MSRLLPLLLLAACAHHPRRAYLNTLHDQTDLGVVYRGFGTALRIRATYLSAPFREALADERERLLGEASTDHAAYRARMADEHTAYHEVIFTAESDLEAVTTFGENDGGWRLRLLVDGIEEELVTVYRVRQPSALQSELFAHKNLWNELWVARFVRTVAAPAEVKLVVGSGFGHTELAWTGAAVE